jgi:hypothetical protein
MLGRILLRGQASSLEKADYDSLASFWLNQLVSGPFPTLSVDIKVVWTGAGFGFLPGLEFLLYSTKSRCNFNYIDVWTDLPHTAIMAKSGLKMLLIARISWGRFVSATHVSTTFVSPVGQWLGDLAGSNLDLMLLLLYEPEVAGLCIQAPF